VPTSDLPFLLLTYATTWRKSSRVRAAVFFRLVAILGCGFLRKKRVSFLSLVTVFRRANPYPLGIETGAGGIRPRLPFSPLAAPSMGVWMPYPPPTYPMAANSVWGGMFPGPALFQRQSQPPQPATSAVPQVDDLDTLSKVDESESANPETEDELGKLPFRFCSDLTLPSGPLNPWKRFRGPLGVY
jgi:hypothetical protein